MLWLWMLVHLIRYGRAEFTINDFSGWIGIGKWACKLKTKIRTAHKSESGSDFNAFGTPSGTRTLDTLIKSQVLYQLS